MKTWLIHAYKKRVYLPDKTYILHDITNVQIEAENEKEALKQAKEIIKRKYYRVAQVWEKTEDQKFQAEFQMTQMQIQMETLRALRGGKR